MPMVVDVSPVYVLPGSLFSREVKETSSTAGVLIEWQPVAQLNFPLLPEARGSRPKVLMLTPWPPSPFDGSSKRIHWVEPPSGPGPERVDGVGLPPELSRRCAAAMAKRLSGSLAMGLPVVATERATAGLAAQPGRDLLVADSDAAFADTVVRLLESARLREEIGANGRRLANARSDWRSRAKELGQLHDELLAPRQST
jgi:glycosyltransferase involved in cell wall biosynthesis